MSQYYLLIIIQFLLILLVCQITGKALASSKKKPLAKTWAVCRSMNRCEDNKWREGVSESVVLA